ncbi:MAG: flippase-like domain-containing protein [Ardenticatenaceae bacterium]|nr:flippase-like domain-containing protein [Ardenticatenaceae bacterium]
MSDSKPGLRGRRVLLLLVLIGFVALVTSRFTDLKGLASTLLQGRWQWILAAILLHVLYFGLYAKLYQFGFRTVEVESDAIRLLPVLFASLFVNAVAPTGGAGGAALFVDDAVQQGQSGARTAVGTVLVLVADLSTLIPFVLAGVVFLAIQHELRIYHIAGVTIFFLFIGILIGALLLARWRPQQLRRLLGWLHRRISQVGSWFNHPNLLSDDWAAQNADQLCDATAAIAEHPNQLGLALAAAMFLHIVNLAGLYMLFLAFQQTVAIGILLAAFGMGIVFFVVSVFQGAGAVEAIMTLVFTAAGIPKTKAVVISLAFRGLNFWLPLLIGFFFLRKVRSFGAESRPQTGEKQTEKGLKTEGEPD